MCIGNKLYKLRMNKKMSYSELSNKTKLPTNVIKGMEEGYISLNPIEIFKLSEALDINYIDLCSTWDEVEECLSFKLVELYSMKTSAELKILNKKGFYVPNYTKFYPHEYTLQTIYDMCSYHRKNLLGVKIKLYRLSERLGITVSVDKIRLSTICNIAFYKNLSLSYVLGGNK